jgi:TP901 family phage tail tape measure protein
VASGANFDAEIRLNIAPFIASVQRAQSEVAKLSNQIDALNKKTLSTRVAGGAGAAAPAARSAGPIGMQGAMQSANAEMARRQNLVQSSMGAERGLARERYALYDVAAAYAIVAAGATATIAATAGAAIEYERAFANVARTTEFNSVKIGAAADSMKESLRALAAEIPVSFKGITEIATIGNQLGIAQGALVSFTETVAKFSATTGVTIEGTAMAFGRIGELLGVPANEFENLGSSIAFAGVNAVATEEQILSVTKEIATTAKMAKFTTPEIVGLSTALSSLGIAPEAARGSIIRSFAGINAAISEGGARLQQYAQIAGMSAEEFGATWQENGQVAFDAFLQGLQSLSDNGKNLDSVLREIGMKNVRDIQTIQKLGDNYAVYASSLEDANQGYEEGIFLSSAYSTIQDTMAAKLEVLNNNFMNLKATLGEGAVATGVFGFGLKNLVEVIGDVLKGLDNFAKSPLGSFVVGLTGVLIALVAAIAAINAVAALGRASMLAFATSMGVAKVSADGLTTSIDKAALRGAIFNNVLKAGGWMLVISTVIGGLSLLADAFTPVEQKASNLFGGFEGLQEALGADYSAALEKYGTDAAVGLAIASEEIRGQTVDVESNNDAVRRAAQQQEGLATIAGVDLANGIKDATDEIRTQNVVLGENFNAWVASSIASTEAFQNFAMDTGAMSALQEIGFNLQEAIDIAANGGSVLNYIRDLGQAAERTGNLSFDASVKLAGLLAQSNVPVFGNPLGDYAAAIEGSVAQAYILGGVMTEVGSATGDAVTEIEDFEKGTRGAAKALRTVVDYANDLRTVFSRAFEIRFGRREALDDIASGWNNIAEKAESAKEAIRNANAEIAELAADKSILTYQLTVAERYGDEQRAAIIRAKIAKIDNSVAENKKEISDATTEITKSTDGNTESAIENRNVLREQVQSYASYIEMLSKTGVKGKELRARVRELKEEFKTNAIEAGFSNEALKPYLKTFDDMGKVIRDTPRNVDIEFKANVSPAEQAVKEFIAKTNKLSATVTVKTNNIVTTTNTPAAGGTGGGATAPAVQFGTMDNPYTTGIMPGMSIPSGTRTLSVPLGSYVQMPKGLYMHGISLSGNSAVLRYGSAKNNINGKAIAIAGRLTRVQADFAGNLNSLSKFADGGFVSGSGSGTSDSIPAMLSNGEYVVRAASVKTYGLDFLNAINQQKVGAFTGSVATGGTTSNSTVAYLSPEDRSLLRAVIDRPVNLYTENAKIASSANAGNVVLAQRGTN